MEGVWFCTMKEHVIKLMPGDELLRSIENYCYKHDIEAGYIGTCVGSLSQVCFRKGYTRTKLTLKGPFEIVSMEGTVSKGGLHIHASVSDDDFKVRGGHLVSNTFVQSTAEIVIVELENYELSRSRDLGSQYKSLKIIEISDAKSEN